MIFSSFSFSSLNLFVSVFLKVWEIGNKLRFDATLHNKLMFGLGCMREYLLGRFEGCLFNICHS